MKPFSVVIPSRNADNLAPCLEALFRLEPTLPKDHIIVLDDGVDPEFRARVPVRWIDGIKPFIFARAANQGIRAAGQDAILMNDDSRLLTPSGFTNLVVARPDDFGIVSAAIRENVGNLQQLPARWANGTRQLHGALAFICVLISWDAFESVGPFDERFTAYGSEDNDYCMRVHQSGLKEGVFDRTIVAHDGVSTFRSMPDNIDQLHQGREILKNKWKM